MAGRPSKYDPKFCEQATKLCKLGATDLEVADFIGVNVATLYRWKTAHPEFCEALKTGKDEADERVRQSLYHKAIGYSFDAVKIFNDGGKPLVVPYREHVPPSDTACIFWLKNRDPDNWRDKHEVEHTHRTADMSDDELQRIARGGSDRASETPGNPPVTH